MRGTIMWWPKYPVIYEINTGYGCRRSAAVRLDKE